MNMIAKLGRPPNQFYIKICKTKLKSMHGLKLHSNPLQSSHMFEKYLNLEGFLEMSLKIKICLEKFWKSTQSIEKSLNSSIFCRT